jgi:hypothetical protein
MTSRKRAGRDADTLGFAHTTLAESRYCTGRSAIGIRFDRDPSRSRAGLADDPIAALADAAGAATPYAGLLHDVRCAIVVHGKSFAESHLNIPCFARFLKAGRTLSTAH